MTRDAIPNMHSYDAATNESNGYQSAHVTVYSHGGTLEAGRWTSVRDSSGRPYQRRTIRAVDADGRVVTLYCFRDLPDDRI